MGTSGEMGQLREFAGSVDVFDPENGILGWALDKADPARPVTVRLVVAGLELASAVTGDIRSDVAEALDLDTEEVGFNFPPDAFDTFLGLPDVYAAARPELFVEDDADPLPSPIRLPVVAKCKWLAQRRGMSVSATDSFADIPASLDVLATEAFLLSLEPQPETSESVGYIEAFRRLDPDTFVVFGWVGGEVPETAPGWVTQGGDHPSALLIATYERDDLPEGATAFIGLMRTGWSPDPEGIGFQITLRGPEGTVTLASITAIAQPEPQETVAWIEAIIAKQHEPGNLRAVRDFVHKEAGRPAAELSGTLDCAIDRVLLLPGFGLFVRGWMLVGPKRPADMMMLAGNAAARALMSTMMRYPREDLRGHFPRAEHEIGSAGFTCFLRGAVAHRHLTDVSLRIDFEDGTRVSAPVELNQIEVLREMESVARLQDFYPHIQSEPFFPAMRTALAEAIRSELDCEIIAATSTDRRPSLCIDLGAWAEEIQLLLDRLHLMADLWPTGARLVLMLNDSTPRTRVQAWASALRAAGMDIALVRTGSGHGVLHLAKLHDVLPFARFAFLKTGAVPRAGGWSRIRDWLAGEGGAGPVCLAATGGAAMPPVEHRLAGLLWDAEHFLGWADRADIRFSQDYLSQLVQVAGAEVEDGTAFAIPRVAPSAFLRRLDTTVASKAGQ